MMRQSGRRRAGFTLIELLVVISIIAVLIGLTLAAVMQVLGIGPRADTTSRITAISNAIGTFKSEKGVTFIPGGQIDDSPTLANGSANPKYGSVVGPFRLRSAYPPVTNASDPYELNVNCFEARYIKRVWPNATLDNLDNPSGTLTNNTVRGDLDANQTLLFFLNGLADQDPNIPGAFAFRGFSKNPLKPFEPFNAAATASERTKPYLDISNKHYVAPVNPTFTFTSVPTTPATTPPNPNPNFPWLVDGWKRPFAYFAAYNGKPVRIAVASPQVAPSPTGYDGMNNQFGTPFVATLTVPMGIPKAYINGPRYEIESGFQIISAGKDGIFGVTGDWNGVDKFGQDDRANFSTTNLGAGPTK